MLLHLYTNVYTLFESDKDISVSQLFDEEFNNQCGVILNDPKSQYVGTWNFTACADRHFLGICQQSVGKSEESKKTAARV